MSSVSICIPVYNGVKFVREAVISALAQDYSPLEVVVCDNNSEDGTVESISDLVSDGRLRIVRQTQRVEMAGNWNRAVNLADGDLVQILSADDRLLPGAVSAMVAPFLKPGSADLVFGGTVHLEQDKGRVLGSVHVDRPVGVVQNFEEFVVEGPLSINVNAALFRREHFKFSEDVGVVCDLDLFIRLARAGVKAVSIELAVTAYREHPDALSANRERMWSEALAVYVKHADGSNCIGLYRRRIFRTLLWLTAYLAERGEGAKAATYLARDGGILSTGQRALLRGIARFPAAFKVLAALRKAKR